MANGILNFAGLFLRPGSGQNGVGINGQPFLAGAPPIPGQVAPENNNVELARIDLLERMRTSTGKNKSALTLPNLFPDGNGKKEKSILQGAV